MENKGLTCCVTGHRPKGFPWDYSDTECASHQEYLEAMACYVGEAIRKGGVVNFIAGGAIGADTDFAETVLEFRDHVYDHIRLEIAVPCKGKKHVGRRKTRHGISASLNAPTRSRFFRNTTLAFVCRNAMSIWSITPTSFSPFGTKTKKRAAP